MSTPIKSQHAGSVGRVAAGPTTDRVWRELAKASFAVLSHLTPAGDPRSSGVLYSIIGRRLFVVTAEHSWKVRQLAPSGPVAVTVPVRRGGIMALIFPIPPATISFHGTAVVHPAGSPPEQEALRALARLIPAERRSSCRIIEIRPEGRFLTYGVGVTLAQLRNPALAKAHVPVA